MSIDRCELVRESFCKKAVEVQQMGKRPSEYFGELIFDRAKMRRYLDPETLDKLFNCIDRGEPLDEKTADGVAKGMKEWALEHGVTHCTHWFQPLTDGTAEKHDSLIEYDSKGGVIEAFDGNSLVQQEPLLRLAATRPGTRLRLYLSRTTHSASLQFSFHTLERLWTTRRL